MIGWMGWELVNAEQDVDIRNANVNALKRLPLGSYVEGFVNRKHIKAGFNKVMTNPLYAKQKAS